MSYISKLKENLKVHSLALRHSRQTDMIPFSSSIESRIHVRPSLDATDGEDPMWTDNSRRLRGPIGNDS